MNTQNMPMKKLQKLLIMSLIIGFNHSFAMAPEQPFGGGVVLPEVLCSSVSGDNCNGFIPDGEVEPITGEDIFLVSRLNFPTQCDQITDVDVYLNIEHNFIFHLSAFLVSPEGTEIQLFSALEEGKGGCAGNNILAYLDDEAASPIFNACDSALTPSVSGVFRPDTNLNGLNGQSGDGEWALRVRDRLSFDDPVMASNSNTKGLGDQGDLVDWGLNVTCNSGQVPSSPRSVPTTSFLALLIMAILLCLATIRVSRSKKMITDKIEGQ